MPYSLDAVPANRKPNKLCTCCCFPMQLLEEREAELTARWERALEASQVGWLLQGTRCKRRSQ